MIYAPRLSAVLDACVLYPVPLRDLLLHLAAQGLYAPKWTNLIQDEWSRNLLLNRPDLSPAQLHRTTAMMNTAFPEAEVAGYEPFIPALVLPDPDDRHVVAAAIRCRAEVIVTANLRDFPAPYLRTLDLEVQHPDNFIDDLLDQHPEKSLAAFRLQVANLKNPPMTTAQVLQHLLKCRLPKTASRLEALVAASLPPYP